MTCSRKSISVNHESGIAQMIRKPPNQQQQAASKTTSIIIPIPKEVQQTMAAKKPPAMTAEEALAMLDKELGIRRPQQARTQTQAPSRPVQQAPEPSPWGHRPMGSKGLPSERIAERLAAPGGRISFKEAAARLKKETGLNIFNGK